MQLETDINVDVENVPSITISSAGESNETLFTETENKINIANNLRVETLNWIGIIVSNKEYMENLIYLKLLRL